MFYNSYFGIGTGPILYAYLNCDGTENTIDDCGRTSSYYFGARHFDDAGVRCNRVTTTGKYNSLLDKNSCRSMCQSDVLSI